MTNEEKGKIENLRAKIDFLRIKTKEMIKEYENEDERIVRRMLRVLDRVNSLKTITYILYGED